MDSRIEIITAEVSPDEFIDVLDISTSDLIEAFHDLLLEDMDKFYWLKSKYKRGIDYE